MNCIFKRNFNNYYNRKVKYYDSLEEYLSGDNYILQNANFIPNDGITTTMTVGTSMNPVDWEFDGTPDYMVLYEENKIISRWYVLEAIRTRNGQYKVSLRRDAVADYIKNLFYAPMFVERASVSYDNDLIFNTEGMSFNQIKKQEILLKDETKNKWIVGYLDKTARTEEKLPEVSVSAKADNVVELSSLPINLNDPANPSAGGYINGIDGEIDVMGVASELGSFINYKYKWNLHVLLDDTLNILGSSSDGYWDFASASSEQPFATIRNLNGSNINLLEAKWKQAGIDNRKNLVSSLEHYFSTPDRNILLSEEKESVLAYNGQIVFDSKLNKYFRLEIGSRKVESIVEKLYKNRPELVQLWSTQKAMATAVVENPNPFELSTTDTDTNSYELKYKYEKIEIVLVEEAIEGETKLQIALNRNTCLDAPYDMFCMPFSLSNLALANQMPSKFGASLYDLQILPYCPARFMINNGEIDLTLGVEGTDYSYIKTSKSGSFVNSSFVLYCLKSSDSFVINQRLQIPLVSNDVSLNIKLSNETDMYRLVSPNYNGAYEFSVAKNNGTVDNFKVDFTYKPYTPYIHVAPAFKRMYGRDFNDARGLIVNGDFSINMISDAWRNYEINNKNYQNIFDSQIKTLDIQNNLNLARNISRATMGITGAGIAAGAMTSNPIMGGLSVMGSGLGSAIDIGLGQASYYAGRENSIRQFEYQLGNVKAVPNTLTKVSAYNINNKYFPFIEVYSATDIEKKMMLDKIKWEGMTVNAIGTLSQYYGNPNFSFFKARLIRLDDIMEDNQFLAVINEELMKGVYFND